MKSWKLSLFIGSLIFATTCLGSSSIAYLLNVPAKGKVIEDFIPAGWVLENQALLNSGMKHRFCPHPQPLLPSLGEGSQSRRRGRGEGKPYLKSATPKIKLLVI
jgi:hypothetical protein